jgi:hypothetical protein
MLLTLPPYDDMHLVPIGASALGSVHAAVMATMYPAGIPTAGADADEDGSEMVAAQTGQSSCRRYTFLQNGGFEAGGSPIYAWLIAPTVTHINKLIVFCDGHIAVGDHWDTETAGELNLYETALAAGMHVLVCEMPNLGYNPNPNTLVHQGEDIDVLYHWYDVISGVVNPNGMRVFVDYILRGITQALATVAGLQLAGIVGFSGGGFPSTVAQLVDPRIRTRYAVAGYWPNCLTGHIPALGDWEYRYCPILRAACGGDTDVTEAVSVYPDKRAVEIFLEKDTNPPKGRWALVNRLLDQYATQFHDCPGAVIEHWYDEVATAHMVSTWAAAAIVADILEHT